MDFSNYHDAHDGHIFTRIGSGSQPTRTTRSWTQDGVSYTVNTTSWSSSSPGISFGSMTGSANGGPFRSGHRPTGDGGLLGNAFGLLGELLNAQQRQRQNVLGNGLDQTQNASNRRRVHIQEPNDTDDDDLAYEQDDSDRSRPRSMFSRLKDRLLDGNGKQRPRQCREYSHSRERSFSRERSPVRRQRPERRNNSYRTETREPPFAETRPPSVPEFIEVDYDDDQNSPPHFPQEAPRRRSQQLDSSMVEALEVAVECERRAVRQCKKRLEHATRQPATSSFYLQRLLDDLRGHESALTSAQANLDEAKARHRSSRMRPASNQPRSVPQTHQNPPRQSTQSARTFEEEFFAPFGGPFANFFQQTRARHPDPVFQQAFDDLNSFGPFGRTGFGLHDQIFEQMRAAEAASNPHFEFFTNSGGPAPNAQRPKRARHSMPNGGQFPQPEPVFAPSVPPPKQSPANLLKPAEAKTLFRTYNERWNGIPNTEPNIPYPSRGLQAHALTARDSIFAPLCRADPLTWSEEAIMQANAQAFYLGVVDLIPVYTEAPGTGSIEMGFDKSRATPAQVKELVDMLKKEKTRWHSDRLGRRNGGMVGSTNEALQKDERARAVFHAVCGLMESAQ